MFWNCVIAVGAIWILLSLVSFLQTVQLNNIYKMLGRSGEVYFGRDRGFPLTGLIAFAAVNSGGKVVDAKKMRAARLIIPAKTLEFQELIGENLNRLDLADICKEKRLRSAMDDLLKKYNKQSNQSQKRRA